MASVKLGAGRLISKDVAALTQLGAANHAARAFLKRPTGCAAAEAILVQLTAAAGFGCPGGAAWRPGLERRPLQRTTPDCGSG